MKSDDSLSDPNLGLTEFEKKKHDDKLYIDAKINRSVSQGTAQKRANDVLMDIARFIQHDSAEKAVLKDMIYLGSAAVHVYYSEALKQMFFVSQCDPMTSRVPEWTADKALIDLRKQMMTGYGRKAPTKRSGF